MMILLQRRNMMACIQCSMDPHVQCTHMLYSKMWYVHIMLLCDRREVEVVATHPCEQDGLVRWCVF